MKDLKLLLQYLAEWLDSLCVDSKKQVLPMHNQFAAEPSFYKIPDWIEHILNYSQVSPGCLIQGCVLLRRIKKEYPSLQFSSMNIRRLVLIATMEVAKLNEDVAYLNKDWVWISDNVFTISTMNRMEREFLSLIHYRIFVDAPEYDNFCFMLLERFHIPCIAVLGDKSENVFFNPLIHSVTFIPSVEKMMKLKTFPQKFEMISKPQQEQLPSSSSSSSTSTSSHILVTLSSLPYIPPADDSFHHPRRITASSASSEHSNASVAGTSSGYAIPQLPPSLPHPPPSQPLQYVIQPPPLPPYQKSAVVCSEPCCGVELASSVSRCTGNECPENECPRPCLNPGPFPPASSPSPLSSCSMPSPCPCPSPCTCTCLCCSTSPWGLRCGVGKSVYGAGMQSE